MTSPPPHTSTVKALRENSSHGVLPISASGTQQRTVPSSTRPSSKATASRMKVIVRRLPPNLTSVEFETILGEEWKINGGKVDWFKYKPGKLSKDPAKPSIPSRAYLHLTKEEYISLLSEKVRSASFIDVKGVPKEPATAGPPTVEFAPYGRIPNGRGRKDLRQGTIDQDQEFISFLEGLTNPIIKPAPVDHGNDTTGKSKEKVVVTPLVQFLKDKKANKGKDTTPAPKGTKHTRQDSKDGTNSPVLEKRPSSRASNPSSLSPENKNVQAIKIEKATREVVQVIQQQAAEASKSPLPSPAVPAAEKTPIIAKNPLSTEKRRERGSASAAAKILQRDLGLSPRGRGGRRGGSSVGSKPASSDLTPTPPKEESSPPTALKESAATITHAPPDNETSTTMAPLAAAPSSPGSSVAPQTPKGPVAPRVSPKAALASDAKSAPQNPGKKLTKDAPVSPTATQAFLKHANPSQGITEILLEEAFAEFGEVKKVEIDKKKGFAYVDFAEPKGLQEAVKASPIKVAEGQVVVLERKTGPSLQARHARGGSSSMGNRGGSPMGPRGGRGGIIRRGGGPGRGGGVTIPSSNHSKGLTAPPPVTLARKSEAPAISPETNPRNNIEAKPESSMTPTLTTPNQSASNASDPPNPQD